MSGKYPVNSPASAHRLRSVALERILGAMRTHALEIVLFVAAITLLVATAVVTATIALQTGGQAEDLTFAGTLEELELVLSNRGSDQLAQLERATLPVTGRNIIVDTIAILADPLDEPAVAPGGFIADQVALFNDHSIRQAVIRATLDVSGANGLTEAPSLLRAVRTENGERRLSEHPNPYLLTVRSPYAERSWREVRTSDWSSSGSLLGLGGEIALAPSTPDGARAHLNGRECTIRRDSERFLLYCESELASGVKRFYDLGFALNGANQNLSPARAYLYRPGRLWRNGEAQTFTEGEVFAGDVLDVDRTGPFMLSAAQRGTLAAAQWINGRQNFSNQRLGTIGFFGAAGRSSAPGGSSGPLILSLDASLSADLEQEAGRFLKTRPALRRMAVVVLDVQTGAVKAIAEPGRRSDAEALLAFEPLLVGSVVKPLVASSILARQPRLGNLNLSYAGDTVRVVASVPLARGFANAANGCTGTIVFSDFIRCSSNQYAAELLVRSLRADGFEATGPGAVVPREVLERSSIGEGLAEAFDVDASGHRTSGRNPGLWSAVTGAATTNRALLPWESRPWLVFPQTGGTRLDLLARYAFGGWENRWTLVGLGEAYARIATGRAVGARILDDGASAEALPPHVQNAFRRVRAALSEVPVRGTATGLTEHLQKALGQELRVLAKTGTLNEERDRFKSLALVIGNSTATNASAELTCGFAVISYFDFEDDRRRNRAALPPVHLEFAAGDLPSVLRRHWSRLSGCASAAGEAAR